MIQSDATSFRSQLLAWGTVLVTSLLFFYEFALNNIFNSLEEPLRQAFALDAVQIGWISGLYFYANLVMLIPAALMLDRFSPRKLIVMAMLICSSGTLLLALGQQEYALIIGRICMGIGGGFSFVGCMRIAVNWLASHQLARAASLIASMGMLGGFLVQGPFDYFIEQQGWRVATAEFAGVGYAIALLIFWCVKDVPAHDIALYQSRHESLNALGLWKSVCMVFGRLQNWACALFACTINLPIYILGALWGAPYLMYVEGLSSQAASEVAGMLFLGSLFGCLAVGFISDLMGRRKLPMLLGVLFSLLIIGLILQWHGAGFTILCILFFALGFTTSVEALGYPTVAESNPPMIASTATSILSMSFMLMGGLAQLVYGKILALQWSGEMRNGVPFYTGDNYQQALNLLPLAFVVSLVAISLIRETYCKSSNDLK